MTRSRVRVRTGDLSDVAAVLALFDGAVRWLVARGLSGQWGSEPFSTRPPMVERVRGWAAGGGTRIAELDGDPVGAIVLGAAPDYVPAATEPEIYIQGLVTDRRYAGHGLGAALLAAARTEAVAGGVGLLRVDCWAGGDGALVRYYERAGFTPTDRFTIDSWPCQILIRRC